MKFKILVIRFSSLGDVILASAPVLNLKIAYPESTIFFLTKEKFAPIVGRFSAIDEVLTISNSPGIEDVFKAVKQIESQEYDLIVDLQGNFRSYLIRNLSFAGQKLVYARDRIERSRIVKIKVFPDQIIHTIDKYNSVVSLLDKYPVALRPVIDAREDQKFSQTRQRVVMAPGASFPDKEWPVEQFAQVAEQLCQKHQAKIIWATTAGQDDKLKLEEKIGKECFIKLINYPLDHLADIIHSSDLCISNDSGIAHLSSAVGTPVLAIFGPTHPALGFAPRGLFDKIIEVDEFCRPCSLHGDKPCFRKERYCLTRISPEHIFSEASALLEKRKNQAGALFLDRDGTIIIDKPFDSNPDNIEFVPGSIEALLRAQKLGLKLVIVSNQSGVARGYFDLETAEVFSQVLVKKLNQKGVNIDANYFCPHYVHGTVAKYAIRCHCRKPSAGMAEQAARTLNLNLRHSYVVGDKLDDFNLGKVIGAAPFLVKTGQGQDYVGFLRKSYRNSENFICENLLEAVRRIETSKKSEPVQVNRESPAEN